MRTLGHRIPTLCLLVLMAAGESAALGQTVIVSPARVSIPLGSKRRLTAYVTGAASRAVTWSVDGVPGGNSAVGIIDATGNYTAPALPPEGWTVTAAATSVANPSASGTSVITVRNQIPWAARVSPGTLPLGPFTLAVSGSRFVPGAEVRWNGVPLSTTFDGSTRLTATGTATETGLVKISVANPGPDAASASLGLSVKSPVPTRTPTATRRTEPSRTSTATATATAVHSATMPPTSTRPPEPTRTRTATVTATTTGTATIAPTNTRPESTRTSTGTATAVRSATMVPSNTQPPEPTRTSTGTAMVPTATSTAMVPTITRTAESTRTSSATTTAAMSTATIMPTATTRTEISATRTPATPSRTPSLAPTTGPVIAVSVSPTSATVQTGAAQQFQATVSGNANQSVTWKVNNTPGGDASLGTITPGGLYIAPATAPAAGFVTVAAVSVVNGTSQGTAVVAIQDPLAVTYGRFLDQASFGPTAALTGRLVQLGIAAFLEEQLATAESPWPPVDTAQRSDAIDAFFGNALSGQDQLRQRVIFALSEIIVESMNKNTNGEDIVPWLQLLSRNAFGNYRTLLREITLDASMGKFLDLANSGFSGAPNENFPREVMQLFSIGLYKLNVDGSVQLDAQNVPLPTYTQTDVQQLAKALTGWTYGNPSGTPPSYGNYNYYPGPMLPVAAYHNKTSKTILGQTLPSNQTAQQDLDGAIDIIFQHPNVGPFVATRLIRALVTSNPSPAYIARVAMAFNGSGVRGDMKAVLRAILLDPEARNDTPPANFGRLRTPMQHTIALARALGLDIGLASQIAYLFYDMNEGLLDAPSVFGHYSPMYRIPVTGLFGPEFQIYSASDAINRANLFYWFMYSPWPINPALQPFVAVAGDAAALVTAVDRALLYGRMAPATRMALLAAIPAMPDNNARVLTAVYLTSMSGEYLVQR